MLDSTCVESVKIPWCRCVCVCACMHVHKMVFLRFQSPIIFIWGNKNDTKRFNLSNLLHTILMQWTKGLQCWALAILLYRPIAAKSMNQMQFSLAQPDPAGGCFCTWSRRNIIDHNFCSDQSVSVILVGRQLVWLKRFCVNDSVMVETAQPLTCNKVDWVHSS